MMLAYSGAERTRAMHKQVSYSIVDFLSGCDGENRVSGGLSLL